MAAVDLHHRYSFCDDVDDDDADDDEDDDERFYIALFSTIEQTHCSFVMNDCSFFFFSLFFFLARFAEYPLKWCTYSDVWLLHGWRHVKLIPSRRIVCTPCSHAPCHVSSCKATYVDAHVFSCYLPRALLAE